MLTPTAEKTIGSYISYLNEQGYRPEIDSDGDVKIRREGRSFYIIVTPDDDAYFRLIYPNFWPIENDEEYSRALIACNETNRLTKVAKVAINSDRKNVGGSVEMFYGRREDFQPFFERSCNTLTIAGERFAGKMRELAG